MSLVTIAHFTPTAFVPGRYAQWLQKNTLSRHNLQLVRDTSIAAMILTLDPDNRATLCRGWHYLSSNDGPQIHSLEHLREQIGYRGRWQEDSGTITVELDIDDERCARIGEYSHLVPNHANHWQLTCFRTQPTGHPFLTEPVLLCKTSNPSPIFGEEEPYILADLVPGSWIVLGPDNGLQIKSVTTDSNKESRPVIQVLKANTPIAEDAWQQSF